MLGCVPAHPSFLEKWVYFPFNLSEDRNVAKLEALMERAKAAGFNAFVLEDPEFSNLPSKGEAYYANIRRVRKAAARFDLDLIPALFAVGHSQNLLRQDPNLAAGVPVRDALFVVQDGRATVRADPPVAFHGEWRRMGGSVS